MHLIDVASLIRSILVPNPSSRPSIRAILAHPFFTRLADPASTLESLSPHAVASTDSPIRLAGPFQPSSRPGMSRSTSSLLSTDRQYSTGADVPPAIPEDAAVSGAGPSTLAAPVPLLPGRTSSELGYPSSPPFSALSTGAMEDFAAQQERVSNDGGAGERSMSDVKAGKRRAAVDFDPDHGGENRPTSAHSSPLRSLRCPRCPNTLRVRLSVRWEETW
jgi:serine/threonine protein kinase